MVMRSPNLYHLTPGGYFLLLVLKYFSHPQ
nr:MAG TPA: hypothetical protein [Caudoviricetes sp.]